MTNLPLRFLTGDNLIILLFFNRFFFFTRAAGHFIKKFYPHSMKSEDFLYCWTANLNLI